MDVTSSCVSMLINANSTTVWEERYFTDHVRLMLWRHELNSGCGNLSDIRLYVFPAVRVPVRILKNVWNFIPGNLQAVTFEQYENSRNAIWIRIRFWYIYYYYCSCVQHMLSHSVRLEFTLLPALRVTEPISFPDPNVTVSTTSPWPVDFTPYIDRLEVWNLIPNVYAEAVTVHAVGHRDSRSAANPLIHFYHAG